MTPTKTLIAAILVMSVSWPSLANHHLKKPNNRTRRVGGNQPVQAARGIPYARNPAAQASGYTLGANRGYVPNASMEEMVEFNDDIAEATKRILQDASNFGTTLKPLMQELDANPRAINEAYNHLKERMEQISASVATRNVPDAMYAKELNMIQEMLLKAEIGFIDGPIKEIVEIAADGEKSKPAKKHEVADLIKEIGKKEEALIRKLQNMQVQFAKVNNIELSTPPEPPAPAPGPGPGPGKDVEPVYVAESNPEVPVYSEPVEYEDPVRIHKEIDEFSYEIKNNPQNLYIREKRAKTLIVIRDYDRALLDLEVIVNTEKTGDSYYNRGVVHKLNGHPLLAIADYTKALELEPEHYKALSNRGSVYSELERYKEAFDDFNKAIGIAPDQSTAYFNRGFTYTKLGDYEKAIADFTKVTVIQPNDVDAYRHRAKSYYRSQELDKAREDLRKATELELEKL